MEFFEKAHVSKGDKTPRKDKKSEENVKNQLKQMLFGYRHSDIDLIKSSVNVKNEFEDSSSVSGYSDLNITNSSVEGDVSLATDSSKPNIGSGPDVSDSEELSFEISEDTSSDNLKVCSKEKLSNEPISEYDGDVKSISGDDSAEKLDQILEEESEDESLNSFIITSTDIDSNSDDNSEFDADGKLAAKILDKLHKTKKETKKNRKRKLNEPDESTFWVDKDNKSGYKGPYRPDKEDANLDDLSNEMAGINLPQTSEFTGPYRPKDDHSSDEAIFDDKIYENETSIDSVELSSPFVSVTASNMESQSLSDILGEYRHPTVRNLPSDSQNMFSTNNTNLFETENVSVVDIHTEEDVDSLIPEIDDDITLEDIEIDDPEIDTSIQPNEESTVYDSTLQSDETSEREASTDIIDQTLVNPVKVYYGKNHTCIFIMKHPTELYIHGKVKVTSIGGVVEILGYTLQDKTCDVYGPNYNYAQYLKTVENQNAYYGLFGKLTSAGLSVSVAEEIVTSLGENDAVVTMQPMRNRQMDFVENNFTITDLFSKPSKNIDNCFKKASDMLGCSLYLQRPWKCFQENISWKQAIKCGLNKQSRGIVCGGKGTGKSTFLRYYVNKLLGNGPMLVIDLDPGQCEFTIAGNVSATVVTEPLLGPNFTHLRTPEMMLHLGMINTMDNPRRYAAAIEKLIAHCSADDRLRSLPWIVNTMGMTNTIGLKFMSLIIIHTQPTFLLQIDSKNVKKRFDFHLYSQTIKNLYFEDYQNDPLFNITEVDVNYSFFLSHHTDNSVKNNFSLAPRDERYLNYLAYFGELLNVRSGSFLGIVPYEVNMKDLNIGLNVKISKDSVDKVINGKVVALCQHTPASKVFTLADTPLICVGAGVVRGVDWEKGLVYMVTPVEAERLAHADTLVYADWTPELRGASLANVPRGLALPYRTAALYHQRRHMTAPKRRFNPLQLLKMSRSS